MQKSITRFLFSSIALLLVVAGELSGQTTDALGTYSPYSMFGIGQLDMQGTAYNISMGGIGIATRDKRFINTLNPAAISARDTLSFMLDFGFYEKNTYGKDKGTTSAYNVFNMQNVTITLPIYKQSAFVVGIAPYSNVGYKYLATETNEQIIAKVGNMEYQKYGTGGINQVFLGASWTIANRFAIGAEVIYYFGKISHHSNVIFSDGNQRQITTGWDYKVGSFSGEFGMQYIQPFKDKSSLVIGATYRLGAGLHGKVQRYAYSGADTVTFYEVPDAKIDVAPELGVGISYRYQDKFMLGFDYIWQDWSRSNFINYSTVYKFQPTASHTFRFGGEYVPNRNDVRYYMKRAAYRLGGYYDKSYVTINGHQVNSWGITLGLSLPVFRYYNAISLAFEVGQRGTQRYDMLKETYFNIILNFNLHDIWFVRFKYE